MKKIVALLLTCTMIASLTACGSKAAEPAAEPAAAEETAEAPAADAEAEAPAAEPTGPVTLNVTTTYAGNDGGAEIYQKYIAAWQDETGNTVNDASGTADERMACK